MHAQVLEMYYVDKMSLAQISAELDCSETRACQLHTGALIGLSAADVDAVATEQFYPRLQRDWLHAQEWAERHEGLTP